MTADHGSWIVEIVCSTEPISEVMSVTALDADFDAESSSSTSDMMRDDKPPLTRAFKRSSWYSV